MKVGQWSPGPTGLDGLVHALQPRKGGWGRIPDPQEVSQIRSQLWPLTAAWSRQRAPCQKQNKKKSMAGRGETHVRCNHTPG
eukprot:gene20211-biopygen2555